MQAIAPGYGLAEHTVYVCDGGKQRLFLNLAALQDRKVQIVEGKINVPVQELVGCGLPSKNPSVNVRIVDRESSTELAEDEIGEIWVDSPSKAAGYWGHDDISKEEFHAQILHYRDNTRPEGAERTYLRTGDLGFLHGGELFVCGRIKDLIIVRGRNHYPQVLYAEIES